VTRLRAMQAVLAILLVIMVWSWTRRPSSPSSPDMPRSRPSRAARKDPAGAPPLEPGAVVRRNLFEYGEAPAATRTPAAVVAVPTANVATLDLAATRPVPIKLVGLVHQPGGLRAALSVHGDVVLAAQGQNVDGYTVVSIDEDSGVVVNGPDGRAIELRREEPR
jgi:hypothetical protein